MRLAREGVPFVALFVAIGILPAALVLVFVRGPWWVALALAAPGLLLALFSAWFFRDPERNVPTGAGIVVSPADGKVVGVHEDASGVAVAIFLSVFDVHVNRSPVAGRVESIQYRQGRFLAAYDDRAGEVNERNDIVVSSASGPVRVSQIAGLIARRIVCSVKPGEVLSAGQRVGLIRFGSRTDLHLPPGSRATVRLGEKVKGGATAIGWMPGAAPTTGGR